MNNIELRWITRVLELPDYQGGTSKVKVLQYRKYYDASVYSWGYECGIPLRRMPSYKWSDWMDVPDA